MGVLRLGGAVRHPLLQPRRPGDLLPRAVADAGNTQATGNATANQIFVGTNNNPGNGIHDYIDDLWICDGQPGLTGYQGDCSVKALLPTGAGATTQLAATGAASNYAAVNEATQNGDTSYVASATAGQEDTYAMADLSATVAAVKGLQTVLVARKDDAGPRTVAPVLRPGGAGGSDQVGASVPLVASYAMQLQVWETNPATSAPWTPADVTAAEVGMKVTG